MHAAGAAAGGGGGGVGVAESGGVSARLGAESPVAAQPALPGVGAQRQALGSLRTPSASLQPRFLAQVAARADLGRRLATPQ